MGTREVPSDLPSCNACLADPFLPPDDQLRCAQAICANGDNGACNIVRDMIRGGLAQ